MSQVRTLTKSPTLCSPGWFKGFRGVVLLICLFTLAFLFCCLLLDRIAEHIALKHFFLEMEFSQAVTACLKQT